jgi:hypothetical protein
MAGSVLRTGEHQRLVGTILPHEPVIKTEIGTGK